MQQKLDQGKMMADFVATARFIKEQAAIAWQRTVAHFNKYLKTS